MKTETLRLKVGKALKRMLKMNYNIMLLDMAVYPHYVGWTFAVSFRHDPNKNWNPKIIMYSDVSKKLIVSDKYNDPNPTEIDAQTVLLYSPEDKPPKTTA